ncbi:MAG: hypothetical protein R3F59_14760 [Myxococcota bacterium]
MNFKTQLVIATLILLGGCPIPPLTTTTKTDIPQTDSTTTLQPTRRPTRTPGG